MRMFGWLRIQNWKLIQVPNGIYYTCSSLSSIPTPTPLFCVEFACPSKNKKKPVLPLLAALSTQWPLPRAYRHCHVLMQLPLVCILPIAVWLIDFDLPRSLFGTKVRDPIFLGRAA
jgi:hypothetical protein